MAEADDERQELEEKIRKYRRLMWQVDELTARRIRSLIEDLEQMLRQSEKPDRVP